ncbi:MAG: 30S ribosomal protein S6e [Sulfolobales archaeon]|nr:30S ribosomal protein S6e [Sulfolobales archaeon]MDW8011201.1 30S ribosomal protein S6e [Sulfolobales archaeon]
MATFKVVVGDPEARELRRLYARVAESKDIKFSEAMKEGKEFVRARASPKLVELLGTPYRVATIRVWKDRAKKEKFSLTVRLEPDASVPEGTIYVPEGSLSEKLGSSEAVAEVSRARSFQIVVDGSRAAVFIGKKIGDTVDASVVGIPGKKLLITGGSDSSGFPMLESVPGSAKRALLLSSPPGYHPKSEGERRRKIVRGNTISEEIVQVNTKIVD